MRRGLTTVQTIVAVVVVGAVLAVGIPFVARRSSKGDMTAARADLQELARAQEGWFYERAAYAPSADTLKVKASEGVRLTVTEATSTGWSATAVAPSGARCAVYFGAARPVAPATVAGQISCE